MSYAGRAKAMMQSIKMVTRIVSILAVAAGAVQLQAQLPAPVLIPNVVTTVAGNAQAPATVTFGGDGGLATSANLNLPANVVVDQAGNLYIADDQNNVIREVNAQTGIISTVAGLAPAVGCSAGACYSSGYSQAQDGGLAISAKLTLATSSQGGSGLAVDQWGNLFIVDAPGGGGVLRVVYKAGAAMAATIAALDPTGVVTSGGSAKPGYIYSLTNAKGNGHGNPPAGNLPQLPSAAQFYALTGVAIDAAGNIYLADGDSNVRAINTQAVAITVFGVPIPAGQICLIIGNGTGLPNSNLNAINNLGVNTSLHQPRDLYVDPSGDLYYTGNGGGSGVVLVYAGGASAANLISKLNPTLTPTLNHQYVIAGNAGIVGNTATNVFDMPANRYNAITNSSGIAVDGAGNVYVADTNVPGVVRVDAVTGSITGITGSKTLFTGATPSNPAYCNGIAGTQSGPQTTDSLGDGCTQAQVVTSPLGVKLDGVGNLYIADRNYNTVREALIGTQFAAPATAVGTATPPQQTIRMKFYSNNLPAATNPFSISSGSTDFTLAVLPSPPSCGAALTDGTVDCLIPIVFSPTGAGTRTGQLVATDAAGVAHLFPLTGSATAASVAIDSATGSNFGSGFSGPAAVAVDASGNTYIADTANNRIVAFAPGASAPTTIIASGTVIGGSSLKAPQGVAVNAAGNVYVADTGNNRVLALSVGSIAPTILTTALSGPRGLAVDGLNNVYVADTGNARVVVIPSNIGFGNLGQGVVATGSIALSKPVGVSADSSGNLYVADAGLNQVIEVPFNDIAGLETHKSAAVVALGSGFTQLSGVAVDAAGTIYALDGAKNQITAIAAGGASQAALPLTGLSSPSGLALDSLGNLYVANTGANAILFVNRSQATLTFPSQLAGTPSSAGQLLRISDIGNQTLHLSNLIVATGFSQLVTGASDCGPTTQLPAGASCQLSLGFVPPPGTTGSVSGTVILTDDTLNQTAAIQTVQISASATCTCTLQTISFPTVLPAAYGVAPITLAATSNSGLAVSYSVLGPATIAGNIVTITGAGNVTITASQGGNSVYAPATPVVQTLSINQTPLTVTAASYTRGSGVPNPSPLAYSIAGFVNGDTSDVALSGFPALATNATTTSPSGSSFPITITAGSLVAANYYIVLVPGTLTITGVGQTIAFTALAPSTYGSAPISLLATATSNLPVSFAVISGPATTIGNVLTISGAGTVLIQATQPGNFTSGSGFGPALPVLQSLVVGQAPLAFTIQNGTRPYGGVNPTFTGAFSGLLNNDQVTATYTTTAISTSQAGSYPIVATLAGTGAANYHAVVTSATLTITMTGTATMVTSSSYQFLGSPIVLTAIVTSSTTGTPSGSVTFSLNGAVQTGIALSSSGTATLQVSALPNNANVISAVYGGDNLDFSSSTSNGIVVTRPYVSTTSLAVSIANANQGQIVMLTAAVIAAPSPANLIAPPAAVFPTGSVTFVGTNYNGAVTLGTVQLSGNGTAMLNSNLLPAGTDLITAQYNGDVNFQQSFSAPTTSNPGTVNVIAPSYALQLSQFGAFTVKSGISVLALINVVPVGGFHQTVSFACTGLPAGSACSFNPATLTPDGSNNTFTTTMTVTTSAAAYNQAPPVDPRNSPGGIVAACLLGAGGLLAGSRRRRRIEFWKQMASLTIAMAVLASIAGLSGCATGASLPAGQTATIVTVTSAPGGTNIQPLTFTLTIQ